MPANSRILAVDDNPTNLAIIEETFQDRFDLRVAHDGAEALAIVPTFLPDVVLLDVMMPRPDGYEVCSQIKNDVALRHSKVIMVSAKTDISERLRGYQAGADDYVTKPFDEEELMAKVCAALKTKSLYSSIQRDFETLCGATGEALELISHLRDAETGEHLDRMRDYSQMLAAELRNGPFGQQIDDQFLDDLYRASPLHDLGKVVIPDSVLRKPGPLTDEEREQMKRHTIIGEQILRRLSRQQPEVGFFRMAADIARSHHECVDGSGYPDGLRGDAIPLAARIVKVADVFDAITTARVYKPSYSPQTARSEIAAAAGSQFDPQVVDAMLRIFDEFVELCSENNGGAPAKQAAATISQIERGKSCAI
jgi:putative two-component system response regulator